MAPPLLGMAGFHPTMMMPGMLGLRPPLMGPLPGMLSRFNPNAIPGRFGRDILGRQFAGPGGIGHSTVSSLGLTQIDFADERCSLIDRLIHQCCRRCLRVCPSLPDLLKKALMLTGDRSLLPYQKVRKPHLSRLLH